MSCQGAISNEQWIRTVILTRDYYINLISCYMFNSRPSLVLKCVSTRAGNVPFCPLTLSIATTLTRKSVYGRPSANLYEVSSAGTSLRSACLFRRLESALLMKTSYSAMKVGFTSGTFHEIINPNPSVRFIASAGSLARSGMAPGH